MSSHDDYRDGIVSNPPARESQENRCARLRETAAVTAGRLAEYLGLFGPEDVALSDSRQFCQARYEEVCGSRPVSDFLAGDGPFVDPEPDADSGSIRIARVLTTQQRPLEPLDRVTQSLQLTPLETALLILAGFPDQHEGQAQIVQTLHPDKRPYATTGLAAQLLTPQDEQRPELRNALDAGNAVSSGLICLSGDAPFFQRDLRVADGIWSVLEGGEGWPTELTPIPAVSDSDGLQNWLAGTAGSAVTAVQSGRVCTVLVTDEDEERCFHRAAAVARASGLAFVCFEVASQAIPEKVALIQLHALARGFVPVIRLTSPAEPAAITIPSFEWLPGPVVVSCRSGLASFRGSRPVIGVTCDRLRPADLAEMWRGALPQLAEHATALATRYPVDPADAHQVAIDLSVLEDINRRPPGPDDVAASVRTRTGAALRGGIRLVQPAADWSRLVLPDEDRAQLREAVDRLTHQARVLDDWKFLDGRHGARGVRMLFAGPPGTGKTLSAEVMAHELKVDLLIVDLSRVVSKWIGETEKNLAQVFESAERSRSVLLFDEADSLFGKRTEVSDAHDRYANLETAYLLSRLERFEGLAILSTNLRQNIDQAFTRRLEFILEYEKPDRDQRLAMWKCHIPDESLLADDVNLSTLAGHYPLVGGLIRNAAVAAAFLAAAENDDDEITQAHFVRAIKREYSKTGQPFPGLPAGMNQV